MVSPIFAAPVFAAPHRLLFLVGAFQLAAVLVWWSVALLALQGIGPDLPQPLPAAMLHAPVLLFLVLPPFFFGFLLTTFPRWLGFPDSVGIVYLPAAFAFLAAAIAMWLGLFAIVPQGITAAFLFAGTGWLWALGCMLRLAILERAADRPVTWHAWSIIAALVIGLCCLAAVVRGISALDSLTLHIADLVALDLCIVPVFVTVCHRMIPFFAGNAVQDYARWRPFWVLWAFWAAAIAATLGFALGLPMVAAAAKGACAVLTGWMAWKWWPRGSAPGLLWVLMMGFVWAPVAFALSAWTTMFAPEYGRASIHLATIGFALSLVIAMVTRVTHGHSGRPLVMVPIAWLAFAAVQVSALLRLLAVARDEDIAMLSLSALALTIGILPWIVRALWIYVRSRLDGKPG